MISMYLVLKIALDSILEEANRLAHQEDVRHHLRWLKSRLMRFRMDYESGKISESQYLDVESEILGLLAKLTSEATQVK